jgi:hypothetical protein
VDGRDHDYRRSSYKDMGILHLESECGHTGFEPSFFVIDKGLVSHFIVFEGFIEITEFTYNMGKLSN